MMIKSQIPVSIDEKGFVYLNGVKLPFKYFPETMELEFKVKHWRKAQEVGSDFIRVHLLNIQVLSLLYPPHINEHNKWTCSNDKCGRKGVSNFKGMAIDDGGIPVILFECLHCKHEFTPLRPD